MELPPRLGLGTINIAPIHGRTNLRYGDAKELCTQSHPARGSASTHCVPSLNFVKDIFNMLFELTHTLA